MDRNGDDGRSQSAEESAGHIDRLFSIRIDVKNCQYHSFLSVDTVTSAEEHKEGFNVKQTLWLDDGSAVDQLKASDKLTEGDSRQMWLSRFAHRQHSTSRMADTSLDRSNFTVGSTTTNSRSTSVARRSKTSVKSATKAADTVLAATNETGDVTKSRASSARCGVGVVR